MPTKEEFVRTLEDKVVGAELSFIVAVQLN
jgi:hypothetical protein